jgi:KUP system potassium uptake protein
VKRSKGLREPRRLKAAERISARGADPTTDEVGAVEYEEPTRVSERVTPAAALTALGIVYGDLATSPLYTFQTIVTTAGSAFGKDAALGSLSLIFWALIITISIKYCLFVMRADNHGEGGILALMSLTAAKWSGRGRALLVMGLFGAALIYGDGIITPAISVLSALEGLNVATDTFKPHIMPMAVAILFGLFAIQIRGTADIGKAFGPVMLVWCIVIALIGAASVLRNPAVLTAVDPRHAMAFLARGGWLGFAVLGGVFLALTGGEALYADMGHVGRSPIRFSWYGIVLPAVLLSYAGQTALFLRDPTLEGNPFFRIVPPWAIYPLVALATIATIIASQAIITGSFSLTRQAMQLGWFPGVRIRQTSSEEYGQIYVPFVNWTMMAFTLALTIVFGSSERLAAAYGTAVSTTMLLTTALLYDVMRDRWGWSRGGALVASGIFLLVDVAFFAANLTKIHEGGWIPLAFGAVVFIIMTTWHFGVEAVRVQHGHLAEPLDRFWQRIKDEKVPRVPGTAVFLTRLTENAPPLIVEYVNHVGALHEVLIALSVRFRDSPRVPRDQRLELTHVAENFWHMTLHYGFIEVPNLPAALERAKEAGCPLDVRHAIFFSGRDAVVRAKRRGRLRRWQVPLFAFMLRNSVHPVDVFHLPARRVVEIGGQIEL